VTVQASRVDHNLAAVSEAIAAARPDAECIVWRDRRLTYRDFNDRARRLGNFLLSRGVGGDERTTPRHELQPWQSGQDHLALYLTNGNEYLEGMVGGYKARVVPFNVNYRYVEEELAYLLRDSRARAIVYSGAFASTLAAVLPGVPDLEVLIQVDDGSDTPLLEGAVEYEAALAGASADIPPVSLSADDLYILYTGGTTGMPKGVLWRQGDIFVSALGGQDRPLEDIAAAASGGMRFLPAPPFMHGAGHWVAFMAMHGGHTIVIQNETAALDPDDVWRTVEREKITFLLIVGDAFGRPLLDQLAKQDYDLSSLAVMLSGGAALSATLKGEFLERIPQLMLIDGVGSSEAGGQLSHVSTKGAGASTGTFTASPGSVVLDEDLTKVLDPGHDGTGWLAKAGRIPLGYLGDREKTERTFPTVDGVRYSVPGDRARMRADGVVELLGRDSVTINSGGEKIFAEEVEHALMHHPAVYDVVVCGRPSERWGSEVVAIVRLRDGHESTTEADLLAEAGRHLARYKLPKVFLFRDEIVRSPAGKADYRWAREVAAAG
jgi:3-oxocholest-4-en-26-oate---CoA ligase